MRASAGPADPALGPSAELHNALRAEYGIYVADLHALTSNALIAGLKPNVIRTLVRKVPLIGKIQTMLCNHPTIPLYTQRGIPINKGTLSGAPSEGELVARRRGEAKGAPKRRKRRKRSAESTITHLLNHPVRLDAFLTTFEAMTSPKEVAILLRKSVGDASFHMAELRRAGAIEVVRRARRRGAIEHYYRATEPPEIDEEEWKAMPKPARRRIVALGLQVIIADALSGLRHGKFESDDNMYLVWMPMRLRPEGQNAITELQTEMLERMTVIKEEHEIPDDEEAGEPIRVATMLWFERGLPGVRRPREFPGPNLT